MLIQQTHYPQSGPNWGKIISISASLIVCGIMAYQVFKPITAKISNKSKPQDKTE